MTCPPKPLAYACGADGQVVWSWRPWAGVKSAGDEPSGDGDYEVMDTGEHEAADNTIAQGMSECSSEPVVDLLVSFFILHMRLWVRRAPGIPCALSLEGR
jgi:hypothetical protein